MAVRAYYCFILISLLLQVLDENIGYEVRWAIAGKSIVTQLVARLEDEQYMAFGLSGEEDRSRSETQYYHPPSAN